jgi:hypothetical protein
VGHQFLLNILLLLVVVRVVDLIIILVKAAVALEVIALL